VKEMVMNIRGSVIAVLSVAALASGDAQDRSQDIPGARLSIAA
jgi:hypothetical protein